MKKLVLLMAIVTFISCSNDKKEASQNTTQTPLTIADPYVLYDNGLYYAYGTSSPDGIMCYTSVDLEHWELVGLALHKDNSYADRWFWAPEVYKLEEGKYAMAYSADEHICIAFSSSPIGPFVQEDKKPMREEKGIDNHIFFDTDGQKYIYFDRFTNGNEIWVAKLTDNFEIDEESLTSCFYAEEPWETYMAKVVEGPFVLKHEDVYIMTYSANHFESQDYAVGYAVAESPMGPWVKSSESPFLRRVGGLVGTGHHSLFKDKNDNLKIVFHSHYSTSAINPRIMHISDCKVSNDENDIVISVNEDYVSSKIKN